MISTRERYAELLALTKHYLLQEFQPSDKLLAESESYSYFKAYALQNQKKANPVKFVEKTVASLPSIPTPEPKAFEKFEKPKITQAAESPPNPKIEVTQTKQASPTSFNLETAVQGDKMMQGFDSKNSVNLPPSTAVSRFKLEMPAPTQTTDFTELRKIMHEKLPRIQWIDHPPDDTEAKELANRWTQTKQAPQVIILSFDEPPKHQLFLSNIAKALKLFGFHVIIANATKMAQNLNSKELKLIIACSSHFFHLTELQKHYREDSKDGRHYLGDHLLLLLSDLGFYLKEPALKQSLWKALKELLTLA